MPKAKSQRKREAHLYNSFLIYCGLFGAFMPSLHHAQFYYYFKFELWTVFSRMSGALTVVGFHLHFVLTLEPIRFF